MSHLPSEEILNVITHGIGALFSIIAVPVLLWGYGYLDSDWTDLLGVSMFCIGLLMVYCASTGYHFTLGMLKAKWRVFDHIAIFFLIGGTYTAYLLKYIEGSSAITFLLTQWAIIIIGILLKLFYTGKFEVVSTLLYVLLGWMAVLIIEPLRTSIPKEVISWLIAGGLSYSIGVVFYLFDHYKYAHTVWHVFVLGGSTFHFIGLCY